MSKLPVKPLIIQIKSKYYQPSYDCLFFTEWLIMLMLQLKFDVTVIELPTFTPNKELWKWTDLGKHEDEIYAQAVWEVMLKAGNLKWIDHVDWKNNLEFS